jgi:hypothetical protein
MEELGRIADKAKRRAAGGIDTRRQQIAADAIAGRRTRLLRRLSPGRFQRDKRRDAWPG